MKLLIATAIKEDLQQLSVIMQKAHVSVFSVSETVGHKTEQKDYMPDNWFGKTGDGTDAVFLFSFTEDEKAIAVLDLVKAHNEATRSDFPLHVFICPVENASI
jgi:hypothetical protein